jgi:protein-tyrosine kinase
MGKISEALEKAARDGFKGTDAEGKIDPRLHAKAAPEPKAFAEAEKAAEVPPEPDIVPAKQTAAPVTPAVMIETPTPASPLTSSIPDTRAAGPEKPDEPSIVVRAPQPHHVQENKKIGAVKPSRHDAIPSPDRVAEAPSLRAGDGKGNTYSSGVKVTSRGDLRINYSRTRIQASDPERLKENKIFSIFDDIETTDQIKILRTQVLKKLEDIGGNSILVTSANPYEGKTFTSINLGVSIAKEFKRTVLIIDADLRKPTKRHTAFSTEFFTLDVKIGLTDYLQGKADIPDILINPGIDKLTLIPSGKPVNNAPELLSSTLMEEMMEEIKNRYPADRVVIVDGPALLPFPDALILSRYVDGVLPVVEVERTSADKLKKMIEMLKETNVIGTVMNKNKG